VKVIVSLTSIQERSHILGKTIFSLRQQTYKPDKIVLQLPYDSPNEWAGVSNCRVEQDLGPITKLIPTLDMCSDDDIIILVDDDTVYSPNCIGNILKYMRPNCSVSHWARKWNTRHLKFHSNVHGPIRVDVLESVSMAGHWVRDLKPKIDLMLEIMERVPEAKFCDDIVISAVLNNKLIIPSPGIRIKHDADNTTELSRINLNGRNDRVFLEIKKLFNAFK
jgi:hypothetical protein